MIIDDFAYNNHLHNFKTSFISPWSDNRCKGYVRDQSHVVYSIVLLSCKPTAYMIWYVEAFYFFAWIR